MTQHHRFGRANWAARGKKPKRTTLQFESLEDRWLPAAQVAGTVLPNWFESVGGNTASHAGQAAWTAAGQSTGVQSASGQSDTQDWIVQFDTASVAGLASVAATGNLLAPSFEVLRGLGLVGQVLVRSHGLDAAAARGLLSSNIHVAAFELDVAQGATAVPNDPQYGQLWGLNNTGQSSGTADADIDAPAAWDLTTGNRGVVVAVIDTGVDYTHPDLAANMWRNPGEVAGNGRDDDGNGFIDDVYGYDFVNNDGDPFDDQSHGTHVAGTIAAAGNNGTGTTGVAWNASIMALKFLSSSGAGYTSDAVRAINYATMMRSRYGVNVRVANNSWGGGIGSTALRDAIVASGNAGILVVAAAGNAGQNNDVTGNYPSNYEAANLIAVAATDRNDRLASFSNYGAISVDLAAPGVSIYSTVPGGRYASYSGTSMATPHVAGVAALAWALAPNATVAQVRDAILNGADRLASLSGKVATGGRLNAYNTLQLLRPSQPQRPIIDSLTLSPSSMTAGAVGTLAANGVRDPDGLVAGVSFYFDIDRDGVCEASDRSWGAIDSSSPAWSVSFNTAGLAAGQYTVFAIAWDNQGQGSNVARATLSIRGQNNGPALAAIAATTMSTSEDSRTIALAGSDPDGDPLTYSAEALAVDPLAQKAYDLDRRLGLSYAGSYFQNFGGAQEKHLRGSDNRWYFLLPNGELRQWTGSVAASPLVDQLSAAYYADPALLHSASAPLGRAIAGLTVRVSGNQLIVDPPAGFVGQFYVRATVSDGIAAASQTFLVQVVNQAPQTGAVANQAIAATEGAVPFDSRAGHVVDEAIRHALLWSDLPTVAGGNGGNNRSSSTPATTAIERRLDVLAELFGQLLPRPGSSAASGGEPAVQQIVDAVLADWTIRGLSGWQS